MLIPAKPCSITFLVTLFAMGLMVVSCSKPQDSPAYQAACQGGTLFTIESRDQALEDGYAINHIYNCIDKASFVAENEERARIAAAKTPEGIAKANQEKAERDAEWDKNIAEERAQRAATVESQRVDTSPLSVVLRNVDVNTATESELTSVISVSTKVAAQIIEERNKRRFNDWADLVRRVIGLSAAQTAVYASICGLNVDGKSLDGAPPDATMAASIYKKYQKYQTN